jgi:hypothetical protein
MDWDILSILNSEDKTLAWLGALALAAGGTALVVAAYIQVQRLRRRFGGFGLSKLWPTRFSTTKTVPPVATGSDMPWQPTSATPPPAIGVAAYRAEASRNEVPVVPDRIEGPSLDALDGLLRRLQQAAESLEEIAVKSGRAAGASETYQTFLTGLDVEYLHRQN